MSSEEQNNSTTLPAKERWYSNRGRLFLLFNAVFVLIFFGLLRTLADFSWNSEYDSYIPLIPLVTAYLLYTERKTIFSQQSSRFSPGFFIAGMGVLLLLIGRYYETQLGSRDHLALMTFAMIAVWIGGFVFCYGMRSFRAALFPLLFLLFAVPIPGAVLEWIILFLQTGSAELAYLFLVASGMPVVRDGFVFYLPSLTVEVAKECSGIRSSLSLLVTGVLAAHFFLRTPGAKALLVLTLVPIAVIKNAVRIFVLSALGVYVDPRIIASDLHRKGGFIFFLLALVLVGGVIALLRRYEKKRVSLQQTDKSGTASVL